jgi:hypothetical protein
MVGKQSISSARVLGDLSWTQSYWGDEFAGSGLASSWYNLRTPLKPCYSLTQLTGYLTLSDNAYSITDFDYPAMLPEKQQQHTVDWRTRLDFILLGYAISRTTSDAQQSI